MEAAVDAALGPGHPPKGEIRARRWCFTIHLKNLLVVGMTLEEWEKWARVQDWPGVRYLVFQRECGNATEREHIQGYIHFSTTKRRNYVNSVLHLKNTHLEMSKGTPADNRAYCTSEDKRIDGCQYFEHGECPGGQGSKLAGVAASIYKHGLKRAIEESPQTYITNGRGMRDLDYFYKRQKCANVIREVNVSVIYGQSGSGKSFWAEHFDVGNMYVLPDGTGTTWMDGYDDQRTLIIEDFKGKIPYRTLLRMLDNYPLDMQTKGGFVPCQYTEVIVTSNYHPNAWYDHSEDPWGLADIGPLQRRITTIVECKGVFPNAVCNIAERTMPDGSPEWLPVMSLPTYEQMAAEPGPTAHAEAAAPDTTVPSAASDAVPSTINPFDFIPRDWVSADTTYYPDVVAEAGIREPSGLNLFG